MPVKKTVTAAAACLMFILSATVCSMAFLSAGSQKDIKIREASAGNERVIIVIDPGHGGMDGGASAADGTDEKNINLAISLYLKKMMEEYPVDVIMTRTEDEMLSDGADSIKGMKREDLKARKSIIDQSVAALAVSIHLNSFREDASVYGAQVFYPKKEQLRTKGRTDEQTSEIFAKAVQKALENNISDGRERSAMTKGDIIIFEDVQVPTILVECGFLSNGEEVEKLKTAEYQEKMAASIWEGINEILCLEKPEKQQITDSANKTK